jgi:hypothetical protein
VSATWNSIQIDYGALTALNALVGVSPGGGGVVHSANLSMPAQGGTPIPPGDGQYELFDPTYCNNPVDVAGHRVEYMLDLNGNPILQY